uniref:Uncharacterized protein n=2 Tax=Bursaphelenchus xylophilus TaxID=6326 RepID=A0A1I7S195_BURXY
MIQWSVRGIQVVCFCGILYLGFYSVMDLTGDRLTIQEENTLQIPRYKPHESLVNLDCQKYMKEDAPVYIPRRLADPQTLSMSCDDIKARRNFLNITYPEEADFPLAFVRALFKDYILLEMELAAHYNPNNFYCFVLDSKADADFKTRVRALSTCFENVIVADKEFEMSSRGRNINQAQYYCMEQLLEKDWKYVLLLENHDILIKTNQELVRILKLYQGANDAGAFHPDSMADFRRAFIKPGRFTLDKLKIFKNDTLNDPSRELAIAKSITASALTNEAVKYIFKNLSVSNLMEIMNGESFEHESFTSTLNANELLNIPGGFTTHCLDKVNVDTIVRYTHWGSRGCHSRHLRHHVCIMGMGDLRPNMMTRPQFTVNKMMPSVDFGAIGCWQEFMYNKTHLERNPYIDEAFYVNLPYVEWNRLRAEGTLEREKFDCKEHEREHLSRY